MIINWIMAELYILILGQWLIKFRFQNFEVCWLYTILSLKITSWWSQSFNAYSISTRLTWFPALCIWCSSWPLPSSPRPQCYWRCWESPCWDWLRVAAARRTVLWPARSWAKANTCWRRIRGSSCWVGHNTRREWGAGEDQGNLKQETY